MNSVVVSLNRINYNDQGISHEGNTKDDRIGGQLKLPQRYVWRNKTLTATLGISTIHLLSHKASIQSREEYESINVTVTKYLCNAVSRNLLQKGGRA